MIEDQSPLDHPSVKQFSWAYRDLIGQRLDFTPRSAPRTVVASAKVNPLDDLIEANASSGAITLTLETAIGADGRPHWFKKTDSTANAMTLVGTSSQTFDGATSITRTVQYDVLGVKSNGTNWDILTPLSGSFTNVYDSALTSTQIVYAGAGGLLQGSAGFTFNGSTLAFTSTNAVFGNSTALAVGGGTVPQVQVHGSTAATARIGQGRWSADAAGSNYSVTKSRGAIGAHTIVQNNDSIFTLIGMGSDGAAFQNAASIIFAIDAFGTVSSNSMPGRVLIGTTPNGATAVSTAVLIDSTQLVTFNNAVSTIGGVTASSFAATGGVTASSAIISGAIRSSSNSAGIGYASGAGATTTQPTSKTTAITLNAICGQITLASTAIAARSTAVFALTNSAIAAATDEVKTWIAAGGTAGQYITHAASVSSGSCQISIFNVNAGALSETPTLGFSVRRAVNA